MRSVLLSEILEFVDSFCGSSFSQNLSADFALNGFSSIDTASSTDVSFWTGESSVETGLSGNAGGVTSSTIASISAGLLFVPRNFESFVVNGKSEKLPNVKYICPVENPYHVMVQFLEKFAADESDFVAVVSDSAKIHSSAVVEGSVGMRTVIGPGCVIMKGAVIGNDCTLESNVTIYPRVEIGDGCVFQAGAVVGSRGFGFYEYQGERRMVPHLAGVKVGEKCSFGANSVVAAGFVSKTTIGNACHFDSFVQIAHNCKLGNNIFMASQSGVAGSAVVEDYVEFAGGAQSAGHLTIGKGAKIAAKAGVTKNIPAGAVVSGFPAEDIAVWRRSMVRLRQMGKK